MPAVGGAQVPLLVGRAQLGVDVGAGRERRAHLVDALGRQLLGGGDERELRVPLRLAHVAVGREQRAARSGVSFGGRRPGAHLRAAVRDLVDEPAHEVVLREVLHARRL